MSLNNNQKRAVEYLDGPLLVLAGPGTGKTQLLSHKVAYILQNTDTNPDNILCLTFTETGAKNMRERLKTIIGADALKVNIGTYHAFGTDILSQYKNYSDEYDRKLDFAIDEVTQFKIVKTLQESLPGNDILRGDNVKDIISVINEAKAASLTFSDLKKIALVNIEDSKVLSNAISPLLKNVVPRAFRPSFENAYKTIYELLKKYEELPPILKNIERSIAGLTRDLKEAIFQAQSNEKIKFLSDWKDKYFEKDSRGNFRLKDRIANKKLSSIAEIMKKYQKYLEDNGLFDFNDMIDEASKALSSDDGFRMTLQEKYQFIMLDEFQDTNPAQFSIVKQLTDYENPMIMAVGDDDQAIYEFQGALASNLTDFQSHYSSEVIPLVENYRSTSEILEFSHNIIKQAPDRFADKELISHKDEPRSSQIHRVEFAASDAEYSYIAEKIASLIDSGVKQNEIAVISYKTKYFEPLLPYLKAYPQIKIAYDKRDNLFEDSKIHQILTVLRFIYELALGKHHKVQPLEVLSFPFFGLPVLEIVKLNVKSHKDKKSFFESLLESDNAEIRSVASFLANLAAKSFTEPLEIMFDFVVGTTELDGFKSPFLEYYTGMDTQFNLQKIVDSNINKRAYDTVSFYENLAAVRSKVHQYFGDKSLKLCDLIEMLDDYEQADMPLVCVNPYRDADEAVQILTAHKAKGLEFEYVFIISTDHTAWGKGKGNNNLLSLPKNLIQIRHTGTTDGEKLRILYVALTRAKKSLYITNSLSDFNGKSPERLEYFEEYVEDGKVVSPFLPDKYVELVYEPGNFEKRQERLMNWLQFYIEHSPDMKTIYKERVENWRMSASSLTSFIDIVYAGPQEFFKNYVLRVPREPETEALAFGNLIHETFEAVTNKGISNEEAVKLFLSELEKRELPVEIAQKIREKGPSDLSVSLATFSEILRQGKAEVDFGPDRIVLNGVPITGKIDHIILNEAEKTIEIFDFKTAGYHKEKWESHASLYKYMLQLEFYKLLLNNSKKYSKYKVKKGHILFVVPDKDGEVFDKEYLFNSDSEKELLSLISSIYGLVSSLSFIDDPEVFVAPDNTLGIKDIKAFIKLLLAKSVKK